MLAECPWARISKLRCYAWFAPRCEQVSFARRSKQTLQLGLPRMCAALRTQSAARMSVTHAVIECCCCLTLLVDLFALFVVQCLRTHTQHLDLPEDHPDNYDPQGNNRYSTVVVGMCVESCWMGLCVKSCWVGRGRGGSHTQATRG